MKKEFDKKVLIGSVLIDNVSWAEAIERVEELIGENNNSYVVTPNVDHIVQAESDLYLRKIYQQAPLVLTDGVPIIWASRFLGTPIKEKISGSDFLIRFCPKAVEQGYRLFYLGGEDDAAKISAEILTRRYPGLKIAGILSPPLGFEDDPKTNARVIEEINRVNPDVLFVALGTPKQEKWIYENRSSYGAGVSFPVGAGFDFISGKSRRAPVWMQRAGIEWFWRLLREPVRLGKRYLIRDIKFLPLIYRQKLSRR